MSAKSFDELIPSCPSSASLLRATLEVAVPLWIESVRKLPPEVRIERGHELADVIAEKGDVIQFRGKKKGESARAFNALAESLAIMSFVPGGVRFMGLHFEAHEDAREHVVDGDAR